MHECPFCGYVCYCDMDDTWGLSIPKYCPHICEDDLDEFSPEDFDEDAPEELELPEEE